MCAAQASVLSNKQFSQGAHPRESTGWNRCDRVANQVPLQHTSKIDSSVTKHMIKPASSIGRVVAWWYVRNRSSEAFGQLGPVHTIASQRHPSPYHIETNIDPRPTLRSSAGRGSSTVQLACKSLHTRTRISARSHSGAVRRACTRTSLNAQLRQRVKFKPQARYNVLNRLEILS